MQTDFRRFLLVCTGNICRSPMAEYYLRSRLPDAGEWWVSSSGIGALVDCPAEAHAVTVMAERGLDISAHRARQFDAEEARRFDLVLAMEAGQVRWITERYPFLHGRVHALGQWIGGDIGDPYRQSLEVFRDTAARVIEAVDSWHERLVPAPGRDNTRSGVPE